MAIQLDHLIVPSHNPVSAAKSIADLLSVPWESGAGHFTPVYVSDTLTLDFDRAEEFESHHYCFQVSDDEFDEIFERIQAANITYRSQPRRVNDMKLNTQMGGRRFYWTDSDGHDWEVLTVSYARQVVP